MYKIALTLISALPISVLAVGFQDSFENVSHGERPKAESSFFNWTSTSSTRVSSERAYTGDNSLAFYFNGNPDLAADAFAEQRFALDKKYTELWVRYKMWVPANYEHRSADGPGNNKGLINLWGNSYSGYTPAVSLHFQRKNNDGESYLYSAWRVNGSATFNFFEPDNIVGSGSISEAPTGISVDDRGRWIDWIIHVKTSTIPVEPNDRENGDGNGVIRVWKNGNLILNIFNAHNYYNGTAEDAGGIGDGWNEGYLLGWANSGFNEDTVIYIDDLLVGTTNTDVNFDINSPAFGGVTKVFND